MVDRHPNALVDLALANPRSAIEHASTTLAESSPPEVRVGALRARGLAHRMLGDTEASLGDLSIALDEAEQLTDRQPWVGVAITMAGTLVHLGRGPEAIELLERGLDHAEGELLAEANFQLGTTHAQLGELGRAIERYETALPLIRRYGRADWESNLLGNRGIMRFHQGDYDGSIDDLDKAIALQLDLGIEAQAAINLHNKAQALYMRGDFADSLDHYEQAERMHLDLGLPLLVHAQKCDAYLAMGMFEDCLRLAQEAHRFHTAGQASLGLIQSLMPGAEAALALGRYELAGRLASEISSVEGAETFPAWVARARLTDLEAQRFDGALDLAEAATEAGSIASSIQASDRGTAARAALLAAEASLMASGPAEALAVLETSDGLIEDAPMHLRLERCDIEARAREMQGDSIGALAAVERGVGLHGSLVRGVDSYHARVHAMRHMEEVAAVGARILLSETRATEASALVSRLRSDALTVRRVETSDDREQLRSETQRRRGDQVGSRPAGPKAGEVSRPAVVGPIAGEVFVTFIEDQSRLVRIVERDSGEPKVDVVGPVTDVAHLIAGQAFGFRQLARSVRLSLTARDRAASDAASCSARLAELLLPEGLGTCVAISPSAALNDVVWAALPPLRQRAHALAPSLRHARRSSNPATRTAVVAGSPNLPNAWSELHTIAALYDVMVATDPEQTAASMQQADVAHLAGHFVGGTSNPLLAGVELGDGVLRGIDLLGSDAGPSTVVVSSCASGDLKQIGGAPAGFATAALASGTQSVIATQAIVEDSPELAEAMQDLHIALRSGTPPAMALRDLRLARETLSVVDVLTVIGAGW